MKKNLVITNIFCHPLGASLNKGSTVLNFIYYFSKSRGRPGPPAPPPARALMPPPSYHPNNLSWTGFRMLFLVYTRFFLTQNPTLRRDQTVYHSKHDNPFQCLACRYVGLRELTFSPQKCTQSRIDLLQLVNLAHFHSPTRRQGLNTKGRLLCMLAL